MKESNKQSELGWIPKEWSVEKLENLVSIKSGDSPAKFKLKNSGKYPYLKVEDLNNSHKYQFKSREYSNDSILIVKENSIIFPKRGAAILNNKVRINLVPVQMDSNLMALLLKGNNISIEYLYYKLIYEKLFKIADTSSIPQINNKHIYPYKIPLPPLSEQKAIADCLSNWDKAIELQTEIISSKESRKKALSQRLFSGKRRLPGFTDKWKKTKLGELFNERNETRREDLSLLSIGQLGVYPQSESNKRDISNLDKSKYRRIVPGDIGYNTMRMWQGRSALSNLEGIVSPAYTILIPNENVSSYYFSKLFRMSKMTNLFWRNSQGLVEDTLNCKFKDFSIIDCEYPSIREQNAIVEVLKTADQELQLEKDKLADLQQQKKALMQQLLTGKIRLV